MSENPKFLHIYAQEEWHGEAYLVGNTVALTALRDAINNALDTKIGTGIAEAYTNDGEGYCTAVVKIDGQQDFDSLGLPYTRHIARGESKLLWPWQIGRVIETLKEQQQQVMDEDRQARLRLK